MQHENNGRGAAKRGVLVAVILVILLILAGAFYLSISGAGLRAEADEPPPPQTPGYEASQIPRPTPSEMVMPTPEVPAQTPEVSQSPSPEPPEEELFVLSFAGDCTFGADHEKRGEPGTFDVVVGADTAYPLKYAAEYFMDDDFSIVNLEGALTEYDEPAEKTYRFRGAPAYATILTQGGVECANLANNHTFDYGEQGYADTKAALESAGITYVEDGGTALYETARGLKVGVCAFYWGDRNIKSNIAGLRERGAQIIIASFHFGTEGAYEPTDVQKSRARAAVDYGADIVFGHHPHVLQEIEMYKGGVIYYSLGNFSFGGNRNPADRDTAVIQQYVTVSRDGTVTLGETVPVPFCLSSASGYNNFQPKPYDGDSVAYRRTLSKLDGTFVPPVPETPTPEPSPEQTEAE